MPNPLCVNQQQYESALEQVEDREDKVGQQEEENEVHEEMFGEVEWNKMPLVC